MSNGDDPDLAGSVVVIPLPRSDKASAFLALAHKLQFLIETSNRDGEQRVTVTIPAGEATITAARLHLLIASLGDRSPEQGLDSVRQIFDLPA